MTWRARYRIEPEHNRNMLHFVRFVSFMHRQIIRDDEERRRMYEDREVMRDQLNELRSKSVSPNPLQFFNFILLTDSTSFC